MANNNRNNAKTFKNYIELQTSKAVSSFAGVGAIVESIKGAILVEPFTDWQFFKRIVNSNKDYEKSNDDRLLQKLQVQLKKLTTLFLIPENKANQYGGPSSHIKVLKGKYFPEWFYCNKCGRLKKVDE